MSLFIGIALGDVTGIGPEVSLKALAEEGKADDTRYLLIGDPGYLDRANRSSGLDLPIPPWAGAGPNDRFCHLNPAPASLPESLPPGASEAANAALLYLEEGARCCLTGKISALVTAPVNKEAIIRAGHLDFMGQTEFLSGLAGTDRTVMMLLGADDRGRWLRVALATTHIPIRQVADRLSREKIELAVERAAEACRDLGLSRARVAVCGLNPHAGEGGKIGTEEITIVGPAIKASRERGVDVSGPHSADTLFYQVLGGAYDAVVAMYHDQGLVPLKMIGFESGVNWTLGLPFVRTSPDHGTAYDIAGKNQANPSSMRAAIRLAKQLAPARR